MMATNSNMIPLLISSQPEGGARLRKEPSGIWVVQDESDRRGGFFRDRKSAINFIRDEFGLGGRAS